MNTRRDLGGEVMKLVMTLLVRDADDIIGSNVDFHRRVGVDHFIVMDNLNSFSASPGSAARLGNFSRNRAAIAHDGTPQIQRDGRPRPSLDSSGAPIYPRQIPELDIVRRRATMNHRDAMGSLAC